MKSYTHIHKKKGKKYKKEGKLPYQNDNLQPRFYSITFSIGLATYFFQEKKKRDQAACLSEGKRNG